MGRLISPKAATGVREALIEKLAGHERQTYDPRLVMVPKEEWPDPLPPYVDREADLLDDLKSGKPVDVAPPMLKGIAEVPPGCYSVRVDVDGSLSPAPYERLTLHDPKARR